MNTTSARATFTIRRSYFAKIEDVWNLWTTEAGIESWWGPEGFEVTVNLLDLRPGGSLDYTMTAAGEQQIAFMRQANMPLTTECSVTYTEVSHCSRLGYFILADFVPGIEPYPVATLVELQAEGERVEIAITFDAMHEELWTQRARAGHESQLRKLDGILAVKQREAIG
jgi:uncharacterized protein YndB with AHSA1/START domain